jgi:hypothetical protein
MPIHRTLPAEAAVHDTGWYDLGNGYEIPKLALVDLKALPLPDGTPLLARLSYADFQAWCDANDCEMMGPEEIELERQQGVWIEPTTINPDTQQLAGSIDHDTRMWAKIHAAGWDGSKPISGDGKHHTRGAPPGRAYLGGWWTEHLEWYSPNRRGPGYIQPLEQPNNPNDQGPHDKEIFDYGTTSKPRRKIGANPPPSLPPMSQPPDTQPAGAPGAAPSAPPRTHLGDNDDAAVGPVHDWQRWLQAHGYSVKWVDGVHGPRTEAASLAYERAQRPSLPPPSGPGVALPDIPFIQAAHFTPAQRSRVDWVVLHSTEGPCAARQAFAVARWFAGPSSPQASAHYVCDPAAIVQCVREQDVAWHAPNANRTGIGVEHTGFAAKTDWTAEDDGLSVLRRSAQLVAAVCRRWSVPLVRVDAAGLLAGQRGITTHAAVTEAFRTVGGHVDPGLPGDRRWPWPLYLQLVQGA